MRWSFSAARAFRQCQRSWFFKNCAASALAKDPARHEAYILSKLQSVSGWRGRLVDDVISQELVTALRRRQTITKHQLLATAKRRFDSQLEFALHHRIRKPGLKLTDSDSVAAFRAIEYGEVIADEEVSQAWRDITTAIDNLFKMETVRGLLKSAAYVIAQRSLQFELGGVTVLAVPDAIAFQKQGPPCIVDWKVHTYGSRDYRLQLALYALALVRCSPHKDFPPALSELAPSDIRLIEAQLLTGAEHEYALSEGDFDEVEAHIESSAMEMLAVKDGLGNRDLRADDFAVTKWPDLCTRCAFRKICWEAVDGCA